MCFDLFSSDDEDESERRKVDCLDDMQFLEQQFSDLKEMSVVSSFSPLDEHSPFSVCVQVVPGEN